MTDELRVLINLGVVVAACSLLAAIALIIIALRRVKHICVPPGAGFVATLQGTPLVLALGLDLLDLALDVLAAPLAWLVLDYVGLRGLRGVAVVESLVPGTQLIPTLTLSWVIARLMPDRLSRLVGEVDPSIRVEEGP